MPYFPFFKKKQNLKVHFSVNCEQISLLPLMKNSALSSQLLQNQVNKEYGCI